MQTSFTNFRNKMKNAQLPKNVIDTFEFYYNHLINGKTGIIPEQDINPLNEIYEYSNLKSEDLDYGKSIKNQSVVIKLNGGLGTSMGLSKAKSLLRIKVDYNFLDIIAKQAIDSQIPLVLMNSFSTQTDSLEALDKYPELISTIPIDFLQHKVPKINSKDFSLAEFPDNSNLEWCPPGHGEIYTALSTSGMLDKLLANGIEYAFISNSDNLGAVMDYKILGYFAKNNFPFLMEAANRTEADKKGGHLAQLKNGQLLLRESAQCKKEDETEFQNINKHKYFNTNNIWINLLQLKKVLNEKNNLLELPMIVNKKTIDPKDPNSNKVFQLETAMGSAISVFKSATALGVPRARFAPVKTTEDLLMVRSDNYILTDDFKVIINPSRKLKPLFVKLDSKFYKLVDELDKRISDIPSLINCEELSIKGDFFIGKKVSFEGNVNLINSTTEQIKIDNDKCIINCSINY